MSVHGGRIDWGDPESSLDTIERLQKVNAALLAALQEAEKYCPVQVQEHCRAVLALARSES